MYRKSYKNRNKCLKKTEIISLIKERAEVYLHSFLTIRRVAKRIMIGIFVLGQNVIKRSSGEFKTLG